MKTYEEHGKCEQGWKILKRYEVDGKLLKMIKDMATAEEDGNTKMLNVMKNCETCRKKREAKKHLGKLSAVNENQGSEIESNEHSGDRRQQEPESKKLTAKVRSKENEKEEATSRSYKA